jgi:hypothetical protein
MVLLINKHATIDKKYATLASLNRVLSVVNAGVF